MKPMYALLAFAVFACKSPSDLTTPQDTPAHGLGLIPNSADDIDHVAEAEFDDSLYYFIPTMSKGGRMATATLPASFSLDGPPIINQGNTGKCGPFSSAYYIVGLYNGVTGAAQNLDKVGSTDFAYSQYKKVDNEACGGEGGVTMYPSGNKLGLADVLQKYGTTSWNQLPFKETNDCSALTDQLVVQAAANKIGSYRRIDKTDYANPAELKSFLYGGFPLWIGVNVEDNWQNIGTSVWKSSSGKGGGHAMTVVGYDDTKQAYKVANSWGTEWGDKGYGWVDYAYLAKLLDDMGGEITVMYPSASQLATFSTLSPGGCGKAGWGDVVVNNNRDAPVAVEITGANNYVNKKTHPTQADGTETYSGIPQGAVTVKVYNVNKTSLLNTYNVAITKCAPTAIAVR